MEAREIVLSRAAWLILFGVLSFAGCGGGGCGDDCEPEMTTPKMACAASAVCLK